LTPPTALRETPAQPSTGRRPLCYQQDALNLARPHHWLSFRVRTTLSEGPAGVVLVAAADVLGAAEFGVGAGAGAAVLGGTYRLVGGAVQVVGALVVVVTGGGGAGVVGLALGGGGGGGGGGAGAGADVGVAGAGCSGDWLGWPSTPITTMSTNAATTATPINVRPLSVLNHCVVFGFGSVSVTIDQPSSPIGE
jgi:hypothetical protein